jgi:hypothetical protein
MRIADCSRGGFIGEGVKNPVKALKETEKHSISIFKVALSGPHSPHLSS